MGNTNWTQWAIKNRHEIGRGTCCGRQRGTEGRRQEADRNVFHCTDVRPSQEHRKIEIKLRERQRALRGRETLSVKVTADCSAHCPGPLLQRIAHSRFAAQFSQLILKLAFPQTRGFAGGKGEKGCGGAGLKCQHFGG